jgi:hypothetical protein
VFGPQPQSCRPMRFPRRSLATCCAFLFLQAGAHAQDVPAGAQPTEGHWSFVPLRRPAVPAAAIGQSPDNPVSENPIDAFVAARLAASGLARAPEADRRTLMRRLWFVMLGVPPEPEEVEVFVADPRPLAYEALVDRVLADSRYGERWGRHWLDVIRFAETNGFETNRERPSAWRFRDYVIDAWNQDLPYDQFVREQIAGDACGADVGTGFLVGGAVDIVKSPDPVLTAKQQADLRDDMVATTGSTFLGLSIGCARCHSHKFDPVSHREYYAMTAIFAGVQHGERQLPLPPESIAEVARIDAQIASLEEALAPSLVSLPNVPQRESGRALVAAPSATRNEETFSPVAARHVRFSILATSSAEPCIDELEIFAGEHNVALAANGAKATASGTLPGYAIHQLAHVNDGLHGNPHSWISDTPGGGFVQIEFVTEQRIDRIVWARDRSGTCRDRLATDYVIESSLDGLHWQAIASSNDHEAYSGDTRTRAKPMYRIIAGSPTATQARQQLRQRAGLRKQRDAMATSERAYTGTFAQPGPVHRLHRGDAMQPREQVVPASLDLFAPFALAADAPEQQRRLRLAEWVTDPANPLTSRVLVNRLWQHQFGTGLTSTPSNIGRNGAAPSHPALLDWLASELIANGWHIKPLQRLILTSATWRQSSAPRTKALAKDANCRLLWRFPPRRLEAEAIRDSLLCVSGQLDLTMGGPSFHLHEVDRENVVHYHPKVDFGPAESRRMVYAFKVRMEQDAVFGVFDCPDGSLVMPTRNVSTTPLQALNLFNSRFVLQQAAALSVRATREGVGGKGAAVRRAWQLVYQRLPSAVEEKEARAFVTSEGLPALCRALLNSNEFVFIP